MSRSNQTASAREPISDPNGVMPLGKYKGQKIQEIIDNDPQYICWMNENTDIDFHWAILDAAEKAARPNHEFRQTNAREVRERIAEREAMSVESSDHVAETLEDLVIPHQLMMIRAVARDAGVDAVEHCSVRMNCHLGELSRKSADEFLEYLKGLPRDEIDNSIPW